MPIFPNAVSSVSQPPTLLMLLPDLRKGWCEQFSQEGYNVIQVNYDPLNPETSLSFEASIKEAEKEIFKLGAEGWALITYNLLSKDARALNSLLALSMAELKAGVHFCPQCQTGKSFLIKDVDGKHVPSIFHLASSQEALHASLISQADPSTFDYPLPTSAYPPITIYTYPLVPISPAFPFLTNAPVELVAGQAYPTVEPHIRSATNLSHTRTLELLKRQLGPHFDLEKLWERHTYYEFVERNAPKTMTTMVSVPYVNHIATMTGGIGFDDLSRFYKYHFTGEDVTPPDSEMITISRTVGADRIIDEMIFKFTHTTEIQYFLPRIAPTGKKVELALVGIVAFRGDKLFFEHLYWDQASALVQLGLLDPSKLPVAGVEVARKVLDPFGLPSNTLLARWKESEGLSID